jgi:hypothetical protein
MFNIEDFIRNFKKNEKFETAMLWSLINIENTRKLMIDVIKKIIIFYQKEIYPDIYVDYLKDKNINIYILEKIYKIKILWAKNEGVNDINTLTRAQSKRIIENNLFGTCITNFFVLFDFVIFMSKQASNIPQINDRRFLLYYVISILRGDRTTDSGDPDIQFIETIKTRFYGITKTNILPMINNSLFVKPGHFRCKMIKNTIFYNDSSKHYSSQCGLSGSASIFFYLVYYIDYMFTKKNRQFIYNEIECRWLIIFMWCVLGFEGGHSLIEIISSFDITSLYYSYDIFFTYGFDTYNINYLKNNPFMNLDLNFTFYDNMKIDIGNLNLSQQYKDILIDLYSKINLNNLNPFISVISNFLITIQDDIRKRNPISVPETYIYNFFKLYKIAFLLNKNPNINFQENYNNLFFSSTFKISDHIDIPNLQYILDLNLFDKPTYRIPILR